MDLDRLSTEASNAIFEIVAELQPCTAEQVRGELLARHQLDAPLERVVHYMEFLRSGFPRKLAHAGPDRWIVVEL